MFNQSTTRFPVGLILGLCAEASVFFVKEEGAIDG